MRVGHAHAARGRYIDQTRVTILPDWLGQCRSLEELCAATLRRLADIGAWGAAAAWAAQGQLGWAWPARAGAAAHGAEAAAHGTAGRMRGRRPVTGSGRARRYASATGIAALPAAADWPNLKFL